MDAVAVSGDRLLSLYTFEVYGQNVEHNSIDSNIGSTSDAVVYPTNFDLSDYGTWHIPQLTRDIISKENVGRTTIFRMVMPSVSGTYKIFGKHGWRVRIKRVRISVPTGHEAGEYPQITPDADWLKPDLFSSPYTLDTNYAVQPVSGEPYTDYVETSGDIYTQTLPLYGQDKAQHAGDTPPYTAGSIDTEYRYSFQAFNEAGSSNWIGVGAVDSNDYIGAVSKCTDLSDIVKANADFKDLYVGRISAINANIGLIQQGGFGDFENNDNYWALSDISAEESGISGGIKKGSFRVGDSDQYVMVEPYTERIDGVDVTKYRVSIKSGSFNLEALSSEFKGQTVIYDDTDSTKRAIVSAFGITMESKNTETDEWEQVGLFRTEETGQGKVITLIGSGTDGIKVGKLILDGELLYSFDKNASDQFGSNGADIVTSGNIESISTPVGGSCLNGSIEVPTQSELKNCVFRTKGAVIVPNSDVMIVDGSVYDGKAKTANDNASTDWGLTSAQVSARLFHSVIGE